MLSGVGMRSRGRFWMELRSRTRVELKFKETPPSSTAVRTTFSKGAHNRLGIHSSWQECAARGVHTVVQRRGLRRRQRGCQQLPAAVTALSRREAPLTVLAITFNRPDGLHLWAAPRSAASGWAATTKVRNRDAGSGLCCVDMLAVRQACELASSFNDRLLHISQVHLETRASYAETCQLRL